MTKTILIVATVLAVSMIGTAQARLTTGNHLMKHCVTAPDSFCAGYIGGVIDSNHALFCFPPNATDKQKIKVTIMFLRDHSERLDMPAPNLVVRALQTAYPCKDAW